MKLKDEIQQAIGRGWSLTTIRGKVPQRTDWQAEPPLPLEDLLTWAEHDNVGLRTGAASGIVVIDIDEDAERKPHDFPETVTAVTGGGGWHLYYRAPAGVVVRNSAGKLAPGVDVRGDGGQVVFVGSVHPDTLRPYQWLSGRSPGEIEVAEYPADLIVLQPASKPAPPPASPATPPPRPKGPEIPSLAPLAGPDTAAYARAALDREIAAVETAPEGQRNVTLNTAAFNLGQLVGAGTLATEAVADALLAAAVRSGLAEPEALKTLKSGLEAGMKQPRAIPEAPRSRRAQAGSVKPSVSPPDGYTLTPGAHLDSMGMYQEIGGHDFADSVLAKLPNDIIYRRGDVPGLVRGDPIRRFVPIGNAQIRLLIDQHCPLGRWVEIGKGEHKGERILQFVTCSRDAAELAIEAARTSSRVRELRILTNFPVFVVNGSRWMLGPPGWHDGVYYDQPDVLKDLVPETDAETIRCVLEDMVVDFPFKSQADRENFFGLLLTPIIRPALNGNTPLHLIMASLERTGKSKLAELVLGYTITGETLSCGTLPHGEEEREKRVASMLLSGDPIINLDNVKETLDSAVFAALLTSRVFKGRLLGQSLTLTLPNLLTIVATGNNVRVTGEIAKRCVPIQLQPQDDHPEDRTDFQHPNLPEYLKVNRKRIIGCLIGAVLLWREGGAVPSTKILGGFEEWSGAVGGILANLGFTEWRGNEKRWRRQSDPESEDLKTLAQAWWDKHGHTQVTAKDLYSLAMGLNIFPESRRAPTEDGRLMSFARTVLRKFVDRPTGYFTIRLRGSGSNSEYYLDAEFPGDVDPGAVGNGSAI